MAFMSFDPQPQSLISSDNNIMPPPLSVMPRLSREHEYQQLACQNMTDMLFI